MHGQAMVIFTTTFDLMPGSFRGRMTSRAASALS